MEKNGWWERIERARTLAEQYSFAQEVLRFYIKVAEFQADLYLRMEKSSSGENGKNFAAPVSGPPELSELIAGFVPFLSVVVKDGPRNLAAAASELKAGSTHLHQEFLNDFWNNSTQIDATPSQNFLARAFLQPYAEFARDRSEARWEGYTGSTCPFCGRKPGVGVLRPLGDGGQRSLLCSFCLAEWTFRRIVCANCGEEDYKRLPVYSAAQFEHVRVECCDGCKRYLKTVDLTKTGLANPVVDELASIPLDLWARDRGYEKVELNIMQL
jgi:FdhE protein